MLSLEIELFCSTEDVISASVIVVIGTDCCVLPESPVVELAQADDMIIAQNVRMNIFFIITFLSFTQ